MFKFKIFLKTSTKKLNKLSAFKNKSLKTFIYFITRERNKNLDIVKKYLMLFIYSLKNKSANNDIFLNILNSIFITSIEFLNSKGLKRLNIRAKGKSDIIKKRNSYLIITISRKKELNQLVFYKKNYLTNFYGKKN